MLQKIRANKRRKSSVARRQAALVHVSGSRPNVSGIAVRTPPNEPVRESLAIVDENEDQVETDRLVEMSTIVNNSEPLPENDFVQFDATTAAGKFDWCAF